MYGIAPNCKLLLFNARSVKNKWLEICQTLDLYKAGLIVMTETWLSNVTDSNAYTYRNFQKFVAHRTDMRGGGVICMLNSEFNATEITKSQFSPPSCDVLLMKLDKLNTILVIVYRPPSCTSADTVQLWKAIEDILLLGYRTTILGDFNLPDINWLADPPTATTPVSLSLIELASAWDMSQIVPKPTRNDNYLDIILTTSSCDYSNVFVHPPVSSSDHYLVVCDLHLPQHIERNHSRVSSYIDYAALKNHLAAINWSSILVSTDVNNLWDAFHSTLSAAMHASTRSSTPRSIHIQHKIRALFLRKKRRWRQLKSRPNLSNKRRFRVASSQLTAAIIRNRKSEEDAILGLSALKFYRYVSSKLQTHDKKIALKDSDGNFLLVSSDICCALSEEFCKNFSSASNELFNQPIAATENSKFQIDLSMSAIKSIIHDLSSSAAGPDGIPAMVYKHCSDILAPLLLKIYQHSMFQGLLPRAWKLAKIVPIYKSKGDRTAPSSYRPISLTCVASKILERLFVRSFNEFTTANDLLDPRQHGFNKGKSTVTNLLECNNHIYEYLNNNQDCDLVLIDFKRAFIKSTMPCYVLNSKVLELMVAI